METNEENEKTFELMFKGYAPDTKLHMSILKNHAGDSVVLGRTVDEQEKYGDKGTLYIGRICEKINGYYGLKVLIDAIQPHKIFICGKTGSGKSYTLGVIAEELAKLDINIGVIIIDPMGIFWSMKFPSEKRENESLKTWGLEPKGFSNVKVFVPIGFFNKIPEGTKDDVFAIRPNELTFEDWCNTFGISIYESPQAALLNDIIECLKKGYVAEIEGRQKFVASKDNYTIDDMIECARYCHEFVKKYRGDTIRALTAHLEAAKNWGIFSIKGTPIQNLSVPNQVSIIDVSFLPDFLRALVVGVVARKILEERTRYTRHVKALEFQKNQQEPKGSQEYVRIPTTWLIIDEAHILVPSKGKTAASDALIEYAKRGRMPGCALVLSTQQPSATDDRILSQVDILITHNLSFADDISAFRARAPSLLPAELCEQSFVRRLPVGAAIIADQSMTTERAFVIYVRPRVSEHAGRAVLPESFEALTTEAKVMDFKEESKEPEKKEQLIAAPPVPTLFVPASLAIDYLSRIIQFRFLDYLQPLDEKRYLKSINMTWSEVKRDILGVLLGYLTKASMSISNLETVGDVPVITISKGDTRIILSTCLTETETIIVLYLSSKTEQELDNCLTFINQLKREI
jgi:hypothetical protein